MNNQLPRVIGDTLTDPVQDCERSEMVESQK
jgi:hypothetical protein